MWRSLTVHDNFTKFSKGMVFFFSCHNSHKVFRFLNTLTSLWLQGRLFTQFVSVVSWAGLSSQRRRHSIMKWYQGNWWKKLWWIRELATPRMVVGDGWAAQKKMKVQFCTQTWACLEIWASIMRLSKNDLPGQDKDEELLSYWNQLDQRGFLPPNSFLLWCADLFFNQTQT